MAVKLIDELQKEIKAAGEAVTQEAYEKAYDHVFQILDNLEKLLNDNRYLEGNEITEEDKRLYDILIRFDAVYYFKQRLNRKAYFYNRTVDVGKYANTGVICEKKLTQDVYSTEKSLDGIQVKTQNVGDCTNIKIKITILDKKTKQNLRQKEISVSDFENDKFATIKFKKITNCKNRMLQLLIEEIGADYGNGVTFYQENGNLIGRLISRKIDMETMIVSFSLCLYLYLFFKWLYGMFK